MFRLLPLVALLAASLAWAQDADDESAEGAQETETAETESEGLADDDLDLSELDELYPVEDEDEFIPSEDVAFGQSIPFPTDI